MFFQISYATKEDGSELYTLDDLPSEMVRKCLKNNEYIVAKSGNRIIGFLRFSFFWKKIPYMEIIRVDVKCQRKGVGADLLMFWEEEMKPVKMLMTSSEKNELISQAWHKRNGYEEVGEIYLNDSRNNSEVFFIKNFVSS